MHSKPPVGPGADLSGIAADVLRRQISWQLKAILEDELWSSQQPLGLAAGYSQSSAQSQISAVIGCRRQMTIHHAEILDNNLEIRKPGVSYGYTFAQLVTAHRADKRRESQDSAYESFDVFLATTMASAGSYEESRAKALRISEVISERCGLTVYNASAPIKTQSHFDRTDLAYEDNVNALRHSRMFVLHIETPPVKPSSVWVEAGFALALGRPCLFMVPSMDDLPYILQKAVQNVNTDPTTAIHLIRGRNAADVIAADPRVVTNLLRKHTGQQAARGSRAG